MTQNARMFDHWIRNDFIEINTRLETLYFNNEVDRAQVAGIGDDLKQTLLQDGKDRLITLLNEGNTDEGFDAGFDLLGNIGFYMAACRRHELTEPSRETKSPLVEASALALQVGASIGMIPRFSTAHLTTHNQAINGKAKSFTHLSDEALFNEFNTRAILAYQEAATALIKVVDVGISSPVAIDLLHTAEVALKKVYASNQHLNDQLDVDRFFYSVRPYYKSHRVGNNVYRGANAGDFAGINIIDLLLGLCRADESYYSQLLVDKMLYMMPDDQAALRNAMRLPNLLDSLLSCPPASWKTDAAAALIKVCQAHGATAEQHHNLLVERFIRVPSEQLAAQHHQNLTASGPPLPVLLAALEKLRDLRCANPRNDIVTAATKMRQLEELV